MVDQEKYNEYSNLYAYIHGTLAIAQRETQLYRHSARGIFQDSTPVDELDHACIAAWGHRIALHC
jgi:hypothetical protein